MKSFQIYLFGAYNVDKHDNTHTYCIAAVFNIFINNEDHLVSTKDTRLYFAIHADLTGITMSQNSSPVQVFGSEYFFVSL